MSQPDPSLGFGQLSPTLQNQLDSICDRFEAAWSGGSSTCEGPPALRDFLPAAQEAGWGVALFQELLRVDLECRRQAGQSPVVEDYVAEFPEHVELIQREFSRVNTNSGKPATIAATGGATETTAAQRSESAQLPLPAAIGRYQVLSQLGRGSFGVVYRAYDPQLDREVALKVPQQDLIDVAGFRSRLLREARASATVSHPNICQLYEINEIDGTLVLVCAFITGETLAQRLQTGWLTNQQAAVFVRKVALALAEAHRRGVVHRDLKPANLMIDGRGEPVVMDFGLARRSGAGDTQLTQQGDVLGTPAYMSPEQARGETDTVGPAADIYSLGAVLYELISGRPPASGNALAALKQIRAGRIFPPSKLIPNVDRDLEAICLKAMAYRLAERYATMAEFAQALADYLRSSPTKTESGSFAIPKISDSQVVSLATPPAGNEASQRRSRWSLLPKRSLSRLEIGLLLLAVLQTTTIAYWFLAAPKVEVQTVLVHPPGSLTPHVGLWSLDDWDLELDANGGATLMYSDSYDSFDLRYFTGTYEIAERTEGRPSRVVVTIPNPEDPLFRDDRLELTQFREDSGSSD